jgi:hypothetical protein
MVRVERVQSRARRPHGDDLVGGHQWHTFMSMQPSIAPVQHQRRHDSVNTPSGDAYYVTFTQFLCGDDRTA